MRATLTALFHGESGAGKSWLGASSPGPRLILDAEGRARYTPHALGKIYWDPKKGGPPAYDGTWDTCIVTVTDFEVMQLVYQWLRSGQHPFVSVVVDSLMECQKRCIDAIAGLNQLDQQDWGTLLRKLEHLVRSYRDLTLLPDEYQAVQCVIFIVGSVHDEKQYRPLLQGALKDTVPYYLDVVGYLFTQRVPDATGAEQTVRRLLIERQPGFVAKDNTGRLVAAFGPVIDGPSVHAMMPHLENGGADAPAASATA